VHDCDSEVSIRVDELHRKAKVALGSCRGESDDRERALRWLDLAVPQFAAISMPGWTRRAEELRRRLIAGEATR
jgi:hypothetical protein